MKDIKVTYLPDNNQNSILRSIVLLLFVVCLCTANLGCKEQTELDIAQQNADFSKAGTGNTANQKQYNTVDFNFGTTTETTIEPSVTTIPETSPAETTSAETTSPPTTTEPQPTTPDYEIVSKWDMSLVIMRSQDILQGTLAKEWEIKIECQVEFGKVTEDTFKMFLTPISVIHNDQVLDSTKIRQAPLEYDAKTYNDFLVFELESEFFVLQDDYNLGSVKPLRCSLFVEGAENSRTAKDEQIHKDIDGKGDVIEVNINMEEIN